MALRKFSEYLSDTNKLIEKPPVEPVPQYKGPVSSEPPKAAVDKHAGGAKSGTEKGKPYSSEKPAKDPNKSEKGFAHEGDQDLKYEPSTEVKKTKNGGDEIPGWLDDKSVSEWVAVTKSMSNSSFIKKMQSEPKTAYGPIKETVEACASSRKNMAQLVSELKRGDLLEALVSELCKHESSMPALVRELSDNKLFAKHLEEYGMTDEEPAMSQEEDEEEEMGEEEIEEFDDEEAAEGEEDMEEEEEEEEMDGEEGAQGEEDMEEEDEEEGRDGDDSALSDPLGKHHHAKHALKKMGPPPEPNDMI